MTSVIVQSQLSSMRVRAGAFARIVQAVTALMSAFAAERRARRAANELHQLNDHMLADIGLPRAEIETAVRSGRSAIMVCVEPGPADSGSCRHRSIAKQLSAVAVPTAVGTGRRVTDR